MSDNITNQDNIEVPKKYSKKELLEIIELQIKAYENVPPGAMLAPITHYDYQSLLLVLYALFNTECIE